LATGIKNNKLVLKVSVVYDSAEALKSAIEDVKRFKSEQQSKKEQTK
jgi:hypothetical protein